MPNPLRVLIADDDVEWQRIVTLALEKACDVAGYVENGTDLLAAALHLRPDVVTIDISMPGQGGLQALPALRSALPEAVLIIVSGQEGRSYRDAAMRLGADGFVAKKSVWTELVEAVQKGRVPAATTLK